MAETTSACPGCGVAVMRGYANCPRCHAPMPGSGRMKRSTEAGGTSLEPDVIAGDEQGGGVPWLVIGLVVVAIGAVVALVLANRGGDKHGAPAAAPADNEGETAPTGSGSSEAPAIAPSGPTTPDPAFAAAALRKALAGARVYATVEPRGDVLEIRSSACDDDAVSSELARVHDELVAAGIATVRCREPGGADVFTRPL